jgi:hypothetical protein
MARLLVCCLLFTSMLYASAVVLTAQQKISALNRHNVCRCNVSPTAQTMPALVWDPLLEQVAQAYINTCPSGHNPNATQQYQALSGDTSIWWVGEDLAWGYSTMDAAIDQGWCGENVNYNFAANTCNGVCGHYTQVVWAGTLKVGCASAASCTNWQGDYYICNYALGGNINGDRPYVQGTGYNAACDAAGLPQPSGVAASSTSTTTTTTAKSSTILTTIATTTQAKTTAATTIASTTAAKPTTTTTIPPTTKTILTTTTTIPTTTTVSKSTVPCNTIVNLSSGGTPSASAQLSASYAANYAFDLNNSTVWMPTSQAITPSNPEWIQVNFNSRVTVRTISFNFQSTNAMPKVLQIQTSLDGQTYTTVKSLAAPSWSTNSYSLSLLSGAAANMVRLYMTSSSSAVKLAEFTVTGSRC